MSLLGWKQKWRGPVPVGWPTRGGELGVRCPVVGSNANWKMALGPPRLSMWGTKANRLEGSVWIAWAPMAVSNHSMGGPPTAPSGPTGCTAAWAALIIGGQHIPTRAVGGQKGGSGLRRDRP